ncbi:ArnT family glycosyltransferase [Convivina praedatoris]|uniref:Dolichyl-phosphate-mannose-protein mannosyltransferase n=1 Tax=Convivina praedatoris TaxID=2880963 RepID=A0ABM9D2D0_9LACO|nr:glycosyltransferase family 39 protein [Convivina sp. LMG 32447]CAH1853657.1 hypothetical protein R077815_00900 [Convivina sp. LMG 32447]CAH1854708.1 hypothetical protein R078138_00966 [Convivina sp. LMG 32447]CAH1855117.1 hypothetical protein LMG032447_01014 [Convivina sp. LMG 32447]
MNRNRTLDWYLIGILVLSTFLFGWGIWDAGNANSYYTAAITSMTQSWHNFWYGAFDPAGFITVDKPPVALWFMAISAKIFGIHGWSIVLPSVLAGIGSVYLMYKLLTPKFGPWAGRIGALLLAITPTVVANNRTNNMDAILVFALLLAVYILSRAVSKKNFWLVLLSFALVGVSFNIKMLQAFMILPAMVLYYWLAIKVPWKKKLTWLVAGFASLAIFTLAYPTAVDSVSKDNRPYVGSSQSNSLLELAFGYNGTERLLGQSTGKGGAFPGMGTTTKKNSKSNGNAQNAEMTAPTGQAGQMPAGGPGANGGQPGGNGQKQTVAPTGAGNQKPTNAGPGGANGKAGGPGKNAKGGGAGGIGSAFAIGSAGPFRLFQADLGSQIGWFLPLSIIGSLSGWFAFRNRKNKWYQFTDQQKEVLLWTGWLVPIYGFFSVAGFFHPYYTIMLAPAIAALTAIGVVAVKKLLPAGGKKATWAKGIITTGILSTVALQAYYAWSYYPVIAVILMIIALGLSAWWWLPSQKLHQVKIILSALVVTVLAGWWALTPTIAHNSAAIPFAGPSLLAKSGSQDMIGSSVDTKLLSYLEDHQGQAKYLAATADSNSASGYIIKSKKAVMAIGGYNGTDPTMTLSQFKKLVASGQVRYFISGGHSKSSTGQIGKIIAWVEANGKKVNYNNNQSTSSDSAKGGMQASTTLYDLSEAK